MRVFASLCLNIGLAANQETISKWKNFLYATVGCLCLVCGNRVKFIDEHENRSGIHEDGELCIKMIHPFMAQATTERLNRIDFSLTRDNGHLDENGDMYVSDWRMELIKYCGSHVLPLETTNICLDRKILRKPVSSRLLSDLLAAIGVRTEGLAISEKNVYYMVARSGYLSPFYHV